MPELRSAELPPGAPTVLLVTDEPAHARQCKSALEEAGYTVLTAEGSSAALKLCAQHDGAIDLLLTDLILPPPGFQLASIANQFPHVNGFELAVRAAITRQGVRVILTCKDRDKELAAHGISRTTLPVLTKPVERQGLIGFVKNVMTQLPPTLDAQGNRKAANDTEWFG